MTAFAKHAALLFVALRAGDAVNLAAGMWLVPKFIAPAELGAVLPTTTIATLVSLPTFAFGMAVMKEAADLAGHGRRGQLKSLWRGAFVAIAILTVLSLVGAALSIPHYLQSMRIADTEAGFFVIAAAMLGSVAPVYTDALQAVKRFRSLAAAEIAAAVARISTMAALMPIRAFVGYFAGNAMQPLTRIAASVFALRRELAIEGERYWTRQNARALTIRFALTLGYLAVPMGIAGIEQDLIRQELSSTDSAGYYVMTRLSDLMNYLTLPLLLVLFPYAAEAERKGRSTFSLVARSSLVTLLAAALLGMVYAQWGRPILALIPNGGDYAELLVHLPTLLAISALTACQTFFTNAEVAAGRFGFLWWFVPMNLAYWGLLALGNDSHAQASTLGGMLTWFLAGAMLRFAGAAIAALASRQPTRILPDEVRGKGSVRTTTTEMRL